MAPRKRIFISDVHIGLGRKYEWLTEDHRRNLVDILKLIAARGDTVKDLVLLGDFFETWLAPVNVFPPRIGPIIRSDGNKKIFSALKACIRNLTNVFYLNGNHDMHAKVFTATSTCRKPCCFENASVRSSGHLLLNPLLIV